MYTFLDFASPRHKIAPFFPREAPMGLGAGLSSGIYTGLSVFLDSAAFATVVFGPAGLPLAVGIQHALCRAHGGIDPVGLAATSLSPAPR